MPSFEIQVTMPDEDAVEFYVFEFEGDRVEMDHIANRGTFDTDAPGILRWIMVGDPATSMKVVVTREGGTVVVNRPHSDIPPNTTAGWDRATIQP